MAVTACSDDTPPPPENPTDTPTPETPTASAVPDEDNPFAVTSPSSVEVIVFEGGFGTDYAGYAAQMVEDQHDGVTVQVAETSQIGHDVEAPLNAGDPPCVINNSGLGALSMPPLMDAVEDLTSVIDATNYEGEPIRETLHRGALEPGSFDGKLVAVNYALTSYGLWYSATLFNRHGWEPPRTWDDAMTLGEEARGLGKYLFLWGNEASTYFLELLISSAIKDGGDEVRIALDNLAEDCWRHDAVQAGFEALAQIIDAGYLMPGGASNHYIAAQAGWSAAQDAILYPAGAWISHEMADQTQEDFGMTCAPVPTVTEAPALPFESIHLSPSEAFIVPSQSKNVPGAKEFLRALLSRESAAAFTEAVGTPTVVRNTIPEDGYGSSALVSQVQLIAEAGPNTFDWRFDSFYGMRKEHVVIMNSFLDSQMDVSTLTDQLQEITDRIREDAGIEKYTVS